MTDVKRYKILLSCPSDVLDEKSIIENKIESFNKIEGDSLSIILDLINWSTNCYPSIAEYPQQVVNQQLVQKCDFLIAIFRNRFGTPTLKYDSGTEEEIMLMKDMGKKVLVYFLKSECQDLTSDISQLNRIKSFKDKCSSLGIFYCEYTNSEDFKEKFYQHIYQHLIEEISRKPILSIGCYNNNTIEDKLVFQSISNSDFIWLLLDKKNKYIINIIREIDQIQISESPTLKKQNPLNKLSLSSIYFFEPRIYNPVSVSVLDEMPEIKKFIIENEILINSDFFYIGNLIREGVTRSDIINDLSSIILEGSDSEKEKYKLLWNLNKIINNYNEALYGFNQLGRYNYLSFVLSNNGTLADEDIELKIFLPKDSLMQIDEFPIKRYLRIDSKILSLNGIINETETHEIKEYDTPIMGLELTFNLHSVDDEQKRMHNEFKMYNDYKSFIHEDKQIVVFNFKKLNNHCNVFFPCRLFFKEKFNEIKYEIKSKNIPEIIKGTLKINDE